MRKKKILTPSEAYQALLNGKIIKSSDFIPLRLKDGVLEGFMDYGRWEGFHSIDAFTLITNLTSHYVYESPKPKRKLWQWQVLEKGLWHTLGAMFDEQGYNSNGTKLHFWDKLQDKRKVGEPIEVDAL